jgi:predicted transposase/invertase (TIGR01784 family)
MAKYINPYTDFGFKKLFGEEGNKDLLIDFLNQLLPLHQQIAELNFRNPEHLADLSVERKAIFDIHCKAVSGERFIVEIQKAKLKYLVVLQNVCYNN